MKIFITVLVSLLATSSFAETAAADDELKFRFSGVPALGYSPDSGFGSGVVGSMYFDQNDLQPYKMALGVKAYFSLKGMHAHSLSFDHVDAFGLPLRLTTRLGFFSTLEQNYCGQGAFAKCDMDRAKQEADTQELTGDDRDTFVRRYYKNRYMSFFGDVFSRWLLWKDVAKLELIGSYRGRYYWSRDFKNVGPYPGSLYEKDFKNHKTDGYLSTVELGLMLDKRDNEPSPTSGYWLEGTVRGGARFMGSAWNYFGANLAARFYVPFDDDHRVVFASQTIADIIVGDLPVDAMSRVGGSQSLSDYSAIGGSYLGRGIREQLHVGRIKAIEQVELRVRAASFTLFKQNFDIVPAAFTDLAATALDFSRFSTEMGEVFVGFGGAVRVHWNKTFIIRADLGVSPSENFSPEFYLAAGSVF